MPCVYVQQPARQSAMLCIQYMLWLLWPDTACNKRLRNQCSSVVCTKESAMLEAWQTHRVIVHWMHRQLFSV